MQLGNKSVLALMAVLELVAAGTPVELRQKHQDAVVLVKQEILEIVGYTATVWVQPPPPSETPAPETPVVEAPPVETPETQTPEAEIPAVETPVVETPAVETPAVEIPVPIMEPVVAQPSEAPVVVPVAPVASPTPQPQPEQPSGGGGGGSGDYSGKATYYDAGLGSCGETHSNGDMICALAKSTMARTAGANPNLNPMCGTMIRVRSAANPGGINVKIVDTCPGSNDRTLTSGIMLPQSGPYDLDLSPAAFDLLGDQTAGVIDITWDYV
ncbi:hypothetical protein Dda_0465 [Drechslerella dactyloides]|uniref:RlpA-like protein double-psi beta-barrel domain-containing protein n=1 Tax=Drechslerella dactyloides TaxID=74499 RepID=A0AAD6J4Z1_DREDA|nr:hypothetical protein Dda_0465 [Drechslerella dactyloides]